jgi:tetratricopeptide (TPR) repeat protein
LLFTTFDSPQEFENDLLAQLLRWMRDHEKGGDAAVSVPPPSAGEDLAAGRTEGTPPDPSMTILEQAKQLTKEGRFTRAESLYARAVAGPPDTEALTQYTRFLRRAGRLERAVSVGERLLKVAQASGDVPAEIEALSNRGIIARKRGRYAASLDDFQAALRLAREMGGQGATNEAFLLDNIALTRRKEGRFRDTLNALERSLEIRRTQDDKRGLANSLNNVGALRRQLGELDPARVMHEQAIELFRELGDTRGEANARANLGEVLDAADDRDGAKVEFEESLELNESLKSPEGIGMNCWQLGRVALQAGDFVSARRYALRCLSFDERAPDRPESVGGAFHLFGQIELVEGDVDEAIKSLERALSIYTSTGQRLGAAWTAGDLARAREAAGDHVGGKRALELAESLGHGQDHAQLAASLRAAESAVANGDSAETEDVPVVVELRGGDPVRFRR